MSNSYLLIFLYATAAAAQAPDLTGADVQALVQSSMSASDPLADESTNIPQKTAQMIIDDAVDGARQELAGNNTIPQAGEAEEKAATYYYYYYTAPTTAPTPAPTPTDSTAGNPFPQDATITGEAQEQELQILGQLLEPDALDDAKADSLLRQLASIETADTDGRFSAMESKSDNNSFWGRRRAPPATPAPTPPPAGATIYFDGNKATPVPRVSVKGFPVEMLFSFPANRFTKNATHAFIPNSMSRETSLHGTFVRDMHVLSSYEYGLAEWRWGPNPESAFPDVVAGAAVKLRTLSHEGVWDRTNLDKVKKETSGRWSVTNWFASKRRRAKAIATLMAMGASGIGEDLIHAAVDKNHVEKLTEFAAQDNGQASEYMRSRVSALQSNLTEKAAAAGSSASSFASNCYHLGKNPGVEVTPEGIWVPLGKKLKSYKGQTVFSPLQRISFLTGVSVFTYDSSSDAMILYYAASSFLNVVRPDLPQSDPKLFVGPADGRAMSVAQEGRNNTAKASTVAYALWHAAHRIPTDYQYFYQDEAAVCTPEKREKLSLEAEQLHFKEMGAASTFKKLKFLNHALDVADCALNFLRGSEHESNGLEFLELAVYLHFLMEVTPAERVLGIIGWQ